MKTFNVVYHLSPEAQEVQIRAASKKQALKKVKEVLDDAQITNVWEIKNVRRNS